MADNVDIAVRWMESGAPVPEQTVDRVQQMERAFARLEAREPTMVLRRTRMAVEELAASSIGMQGPWGRLVASIGMLAPGGAVTLAAVGGIGLISAEIQKLANEAGEIEQRTQKLNDAFAKMGGPDAVGFVKMGEMITRLGEIQEQLNPEKHMGLLTRRGDVGFRDSEEAIGLRTEAATLGLMITRQHTEIMKRHADAMEKHAKQIEEAEKKSREQRIKETLPYLGTGHVAFDWENQATLENTGIMAKGGGVASRWTTPPAPDKVDRDWKLIGGAIVRGIGDVSRGARAGDPGGAALSALGGIASEASALKMFASAAPVLGPIGFGLSTLGSLFGLGSHKPKLQVVISEYERQALDQMKELRGDPLTTSWIFVGGGDIRQTQYQLGRLARRDAVTRLP